MNGNANRWRERQRGYRSLAVGGGLFGGLLFLAGLTPGNIAWVFGLLAFAGLIAGCRQARGLLNTDSSHQAPRPQKATRDPSGLPLWRHGILRS